MFAQEFGVGEVLWSIFWFFLFFLWIWLVISVFADIIKARDMSGWAKAGWTIGIILLPFLGIFLYLIVNGTNMGDRAAAEAQARDEAYKAYIRDAAGSQQSTADQLAAIAQLRDAGSLSDEDYAAAKAKILAG